MTRWTIRTAAIMTTLYTLLVGAGLLLGATSSGVYLTAVIDPVSATLAPNGEAVPRALLMVDVGTQVQRRLTFPYDTVMDWRFVQRDVVDLLTISGDGDERLIHLARWNYRTDAVQVFATAVPNTQNTRLFGWSIAHSWDGESFVWRDATTNTLHLVDNATVTSRPLATLPPIANREDASEFVQPTAFPFWSPDGRFIAMSNGTDQWVLVEVATGRLHDFDIPNADRGWSTFWLNDSRWLVLQSPRALVDRSVVVNDGLVQANLTLIAIDTATGAISPHTDGLLVYSVIADTCPQNTDTLRYIGLNVYGQPQIESMSLRTGDRAVITDTEHHLFVDSFSPFWVTECDYNHLLIYGYHPESGSTTRYHDLTTGKTMQYSGTHIGETRNGQRIVINYDGGMPQLLVASPDEGTFEVTAALDTDVGLRWDRTASRWLADFDLIVTLEPVNDSYIQGRVVLYDPQTRDKHYLTDHAVRGFVVWPRD